MCTKLIHNKYLPSGLLHPNSFEPNPFSLLTVPHLSSVQIHFSSLSPPTRSNPLSCTRTGDEHDYFGATKLANLDAWRHSSPPTPPSPAASCSTTTFPPPHARGTSTRTGASSSSSSSTTRTPWPPRRSSSTSTTTRRPSPLRGAGDGAAPSSARPGLP